MTPEREPDGVDTVPASDELAVEARRILEAAWRPAGYTAPNPATYPWQWLWDSCFHAVVWARLDGDRAVVELTRALSGQHDDGFVPHIDYGRDDLHASLWGLPATSSITQPPMYGHAVAELVRLGLEPGGELVERCRAGLWHLLRDRRPGGGGLVRLCHPWESGADDSPRWDHWCRGGYAADRWYEAKGALVASIERNPGGSPRDNPSFDVASAGFNALVVFNGREVASVCGDDRLSQAVDELAARLDERWDDALETWVDAGPSAPTSGRVRTADALLPALSTDDAARAARALERALDDRAYGGSYGPAGVHRDEPTFAPATYWRGPTWPQLTYLLCLGARRHGLDALADELAVRARRGASRSGFAEYWHPDTGAGLGAIPQSWATLAAIL